MTGTPELTAALHAHARGLPSHEAAVELLVSHTTWLRRNDFRHHVVHTRPDLSDSTPTAAINWPEAVAALNQGQLPCSGSEARILRLAASLADGIPVDLRDALTGLDRSNAELVSHALAHASRSR